MKDSRKSKQLFTQIIDDSRISVICRVNDKTGHIGIETIFRKKSRDDTNRKVISLYNKTQDGANISVKCYYNEKKDEIKITENFNKNISKKLQKTKSLFSITTDGGLLYITCTVNTKTEHIKINEQFMISSDKGYENNKNCSYYLGVHIGERILSKIFKNVQQMPLRNPGYDFICGSGYKIDVKTACLLKSRPRWAFSIRHNKVADFFLLLALDNRGDMNPIHAWLIPSNILNNKVGANISKNTIKKWKKYELEIDKIISCCNTIKGDK